MANLLWGNVYYKDIFAGILREEPDGRTFFQYDTSYLATSNPPISYTLPIQTEPFFSQHGLLPFFDNLVAEGWLEHAQTRVLGERQTSRFALLLAFGFDCAGAVSVMDPEPTSLTQQLLDINDPKEMAVLTSRASLSGVQPKLAVVKRDNQYYPARMGELSTHIAKFPSQGHDDLVINEYLSMRAFKALLPDDIVVELDIQPIVGFEEPALIIKRFDRSAEGRIHFEEFNQLLNRKADDKYNAAYQEMSHFIRETKNCLPVENYRLYARILAGLLLGNTDMHLKNFAMFHTPTGLRLTPSYDQVSAFIYKKYNTVALAMSGMANRQIGKLKPKHLQLLAEEFNLSHAVVDMLFKQLNVNKEAAIDAIITADYGSELFKNKLIRLMEARWNGTFALIGQNLSKKP